MLGASLPFAGVFTVVGLSLGLAAFIHWGGSGRWTGSDNAGGPVGGRDSKGGKRRKGLTTKRAKGAVSHRGDRNVRIERW